jgi:hypothetical protein
MGNANEYRKLLKPPTKQEKVNEGRWINVIYNQCNKSGHSKEHCHRNPNNLNNKLKDKKEITMNGVLAQTSDGTWNTSNNKRGFREVNAYGSIIYSCFICYYVEHKTYNYLHKDVVQVMFGEKVVVAAPKMEYVAVNMVLAMTTHN